MGRARRRSRLWCVELAPVGDPELVAAGFGQVLGLREEFGRPIIDTVAEGLREFDGLVVLDNCEHVLSGVRPLVDRLLRCCPTLRILTTSREPLGVTGENTWRVPSLDRAQCGARHPDRRRLGSAEQLDDDDGGRRASRPHHDVPRRLRKS